MQYIRKQSRTLTCPAVASTNGAARDCADMKSMTVAFALNGCVGTWQVEVSFDNGTSFVAYGAAFSADGTLAIPDATTQVLMRCTAFTSGTAPKAALGGLPLVAGGN